MAAIGIQNPFPLWRSPTRNELSEAFLANRILDPDEPAVHGSIFGFLSETENPRNFPKSFAVLQVVDTCMYIVTAVVI
ncbi:hypothetical protein EYZ11_007958 [Aspergillus tanneri]|uniref:Uncharacterized protein n=1 Tax=Aspergillus tanneri TaxID=1220188 RepID=A0A4S3JBV9_9EURO|nr:hypothetical protein EYZ11_007958 [Aspergillus tanneri]